LNTEQLAPLGISCYYGNFPTAHQHLLAGASIQNTLPCAVRGRDCSHASHLGLGFIQVLLKTIAPYDSRDYKKTSLLTVARHGELEVVKLLIDTGVDVRWLRGCDTSFEALQYCEANGKNGKLLITKALISAGAGGSINGHDLSSKNITQHTLTTGSLKVVRMTLDTGAAILPKGFIEIVKCGLVNLLQLLLKTGHHLPIVGIITQHSRTVYFN
jgi:hypothetical protein